MPRFRNSNRHAADQMAQTAARSARRARDTTRSAENIPYFQRIGFDAAMI